MFFRILLIQSNLNPDGREGAREEQDRTFGFAPNVIGPIEN